MNFKVRIKNWSFWLGILLAIATPVAAYYGISGADMTSWAGVWELVVKAVSNPYVVVTVIASVFNALVDPTTKGIVDSERAKSYTCPGGTDDEP